MYRSVTFYGLKPFTEYRITVRGVYVVITQSGDVTLRNGLNTTTTATTAEDRECYRCYGGLYNTTQCLFQFRLIHLRT